MQGMWVAPAIRTPYARLYPLCRKKRPLQPTTETNGNETEN